MIIGIDGGFEGGITAIEDDGTLIYSILFPVIKGGKGSKTQYDIQETVKLIKDGKRICKEKEENFFVVFEKSQVTPVAGKMACFSMGYYLGMVMGILEALEISYEVVGARTWQSVMFKDMQGKDTKAKSILWAKRRYPENDWKASKRCKKAHDGKTDSCGIANYGRRIR